MRRWKVRADRLVSELYDVKANGREEAMKMVVEEEVEPISTELATSPLVTDISEVKE
jgi:hypothetical protein